MNLTKEQIIHTTLQTVRTSQEAESLVIEIDNLLPLLYKVGTEDLLTILKKGTSLKAATIVQNIMMQLSLNLESPDQLTLLLQAIKQELITRPIIALTIAFEPTEETLNTIHTWLKNNVKEPPLLSLTVDERLIAGCIITIGGRYRNYSYRNQILQTVLKVKKDYL